MTVVRRGSVRGRYGRDLNVQQMGAPGPMPWFGPEVPPEASPLIECCDFCGLRFRAPINVEVDDPICDACLEASKDASR